MEDRITDGGGNHWDDGNFGTERIQKDEHDDKLTLFGNHMTSCRERFIPQANPLLG